MYKTSGVSVEVSVCREHLGGLIGHGGASIKSIQKDSGTTIKTVSAHRGTSPSLVIVGSGKQIAHARQLIDVKVNELVRRELRRQDWLYRKDISKPIELNAIHSTKKRIVTANTCSNMFEGLELDDGVIRKKVSKADSLVMESANAISVPNVMTLDDYMFQQSDTRSNSNDLDGKVLKVDDPNAGMIHEYEDDSIPVRGKKWCVGDSESVDATMSARPRKRGKEFKVISFQVEQKSKIVNLEHPNYMDTLDRKKREGVVEQILRDYKRAEERTVVSPSGRPLSTEGGMFVPSWFNTDKLDGSSSPEAYECETSSPETVSQNDRGGVLGQILQDYLRAEERREEEGREEVRREEDIKEVSPSGRTLSAEANVFVPSWLKTDKVAVSSVPPNCECDKCYPPIDPSLQSDVENKSKSKCRRGRVDGVDTPPRGSENDGSVVDILNAKVNHDTLVKSDELVQEYQSLWDMMGQQLAAAHSDKE